MKLTRVVFGAAVALVMAIFNIELFADEYYSLQRPYQAPMPFNPFPELGTTYLGPGKFAINDMNLDYNAIAEATADAEPAEISATPFGCRRGGGFAPMFSFVTGLALEWTNVDLTNMVANLLLEGTISNNLYQILSTTNVDLLTNQQALTLGQILTNSAGASTMVISNVSLSNPGQNFLFVHATNTVLSLFTDNSGVAFAPSDTNGTLGSEADFVITRNNTATNALTVLYTISGTASNGVDYANVSNSVVIQGGAANTTVGIVPLFNTNYPDFSKTVTLTLMQSDNYLIDTNNGPSARIIIGAANNGNEWFQFINAIPNGASAAYSDFTNRLILSINLGGGDPANFASMGTNGTVLDWSGVRFLPEEIQIACVPTNFPNTNFTNGDLFFNTGGAGAVGWLSADATRSNLTWLTLSGETNGLRGGVFFDTTGVFGNALIVAVSGADDTQGGGDVWLVHSQTNATLLANLHTHLEGIAVIPNDPKYGPWAATALVGAEAGMNTGSTNAADHSPSCLFALDTNGVSTPYFLGLVVDSIYVVPANRDLYVPSPDLGVLLKLPRNLLTNHVGDVLISTEIADDSGLRNLFSFVRWNTNTMAFDQTFLVPQALAYEQGVFAPINIPAVVTEGH